MPQLDRVVVFSQIFWLFFIFLIAYIVYTHFILSNLLKIFFVRWWKLRKDITQIALKLRLINTLIGLNVKMLRTVYATIKDILISLTKSLKIKNVKRSESVLNNLNSMVLQISLETSIYSSKNFIKSGTYSRWT